MATTTEARAFINKVAPIIVKYAKQYNFKVASPIIAQACLESGYGASALSKGYNFFGMKAGSSWKGAVQRMKTQEQKSDGSYITIYSDFRSYPSLDAGIKGYFEFITGYSRYKKALSSTTPRAYLQAIKDAGYATSIKYVDNNMNVVTKWNLTQYDNFDGVIASNTIEVAVPTVKMNTRGNNVKLLQQNLNKAIGSTLVEDGIAGVKTVTAIRCFQLRYSLTVDGIYGPKSATKMKEILNK